MFNVVDILNELVSLCSITLVDAFLSAKISVTALIFNVKTVEEEVKKVI